MELNEGTNVSGYDAVVFNSPFVFSTIAAVPIVVDVVATLLLKYTSFVGLNSLSIVPYIWLFFAINVPEKNTALPILQIYPSSTLFPLSKNSISFCII